MGVGGCGGRGNIFRLRNILESWVLFVCVCFVLFVRLRLFLFVGEIFRV